MKIGDVLNNKYEILHIINKKNEVTTARCANIYLGNEWLIKKVDKKTPEYEYLLRLSHNRIPQVIDYFRDKQSYYYVMTSIPGMTLNQYVKSREVTKKKIDQWLRELSEILEHIHTNGIVHGDINMHNILIDGQDSLYLIDFGSSFENSDSMSYSPSFVAPERLCDTYAVDYRSDFYSVGCVLKELLTLNTLKSYKYKGLLKKLLAVDPKNRIQHAYDLSK